MQLLETLLTRVMAPFGLPLAAANGAEAADPAGLTGLSRMVADLADAHPFIYAIVTVAILWGVGAGLGFTIEHVLAAVGWETEELDHSE